MTNYDLALPKDAPEMKFLRECKTHRVYIYTDRHGDTWYQVQFKSCISDGWIDDNDCHTTDEDGAIDWFVENDYSSY